jgi:gliding motility-associated protein GldE
MGIETVSIVVLLFLSAFFSGSEIAFMSVNKVEIRHLRQNGDPRAAIVDRLLSSPDRLLVTILVGNNLVNVAASSVATKMATEVFGSKGVGIATGAITLLLLMFGEITPKSLANTRAMKFSMVVARPIELCYYLFFPVVAILNLLTKLVNGGDDNYRTKPFISEERIRKFLSVGEEEGVIEADEKKMINSIFEFDDTIVKEIMVPRIDMVCVEVNDSLDKLKDIVIEEGLSRIPVYNDTIDNIVGIVYAKDLLPLLQEEAPEMNIQKIMRPAYYVPETKKVDSLFTELKNKKIHMAVVLDEYGGTAGLVTIEDLLEEIVGEIHDEYDEEEKMIKKKSESEAVVDGRVDIDKLNKALDASFPEENYETISGFILSMLGYVPKAGEEIKYENLVLTVEEVVQRRISKVKIEKVEPDTDEDEEEESDSGTDQANKE